MHETEKRPVKRTEVDRSEQHPTSDFLAFFSSQGFHFFFSVISVPSSLIKEGKGTVRNAKGAFVRIINEDFPADIQEDQD